MLKKYELLWIVPLCFIVAVFAVLGLNYKVPQAPAQGLVSISEIKGYANPNAPKKMDETYCYSKVVRYNVGTDRETTSQMVVYDAFYMIGVMVSPDTVCAPASEAFLNQAYGLSFRWETSGGLIMDKKNYP